MKKYAKLSLFVLLVLLATSCTRMILKKIGAIGGKPILQKIDVKDKDVLFLGMIHLAQQDFYTKSKKIIDSLSNSGYYIFGEGIEDTLSSETAGKSKKEIQDNLVLKKFRKLSNITMAKSQLLYIWKTVKKYDLKMQPRDLYFFKDSTISVSIDISQAEQIQEYEKARGEIKLDSCDIRTKIGEEYNCTQLDEESQKFFRQEIIRNARDKLVVDAVKKSNHKKILIIYGKNHFVGIKEGLEK